MTTAICLQTDPATARLMKQKAAERSEIADLRSAGRLAMAAGGHPTHLNPDMPHPVLNGPEDAPGFIANHIAEGIDQVNIVIEDGSTINRPLACVSPELSAAVSAEAHRHGLLVVCHVSTEAGALQALDAGVDGLAHQPQDVPKHLRTYPNTSDRPSDRSDEHLNRDPAQPYKPECDGKADKVSSGQGSI